MVMQNPQPNTGLDFLLPTPTFQTEENPMDDTGGSSDIQPEVTIGEDGKPKVNWVKLLASVAPTLIGAIGGGIAGGKRGAGIGAMGGAEFGSSFLTEQERLGKELELSTQRAAEQKRQQEMFNLQKKLRLRQLEEMSPEAQARDRSYDIALRLVDKPHVLKTFLENAPQQVQDAFSWATEIPMMTGGKPLPKDLLKFVDDTIGKVDSGEILSGVAVERILQRAQSLQIPISDAQAAAWENQAKAGDMSFEFDAAEGKLMNDSSVVIKGAGRLLNMLRNPKVREHLGPIPNLANYISRKLKGEAANPELDAFLTQLGITSEFWARGQTGAAISGSEEARFAEQVGSADMTPERLETAILTLVRNIQDRQKSIYESKLGSKVGWNRLSEEEKGEFRGLLDTMVTQLPESPLSKFSDEELMQVLQQNQPQPFSPPPAVTDALQGQRPTPAPTAPVAPQTFDQQIQQGRQSLEQEINNAMINLAGVPPEQMLFQIGEMERTGQISQTAAIELRRRAAGVR